jgi:hypothetical protein
VVIAFIYLNGAGDSEGLEVDSAGGGSVSGLEYGRWQKKLYNRVGGRELFQFRLGPTL